MSQTGRPPLDETAPLDVSGKRIVLLLQGGGALGGYQVGAFHALAERCRTQHAAIDWVAGISIGAVNAAVIAGARGGDAVTQLDRLWADIVSPPVPPYDITAAWNVLPAVRAAGWLAPLVPKYAAWAQAAFNPSGQPNFFTSHVADPLRNPWFRQWVAPLPPDELAFYDTAPLRDTLDRHVDWDAVNADGAMRLSLGATRVSDGEPEYFQTFAAPGSPWHRRAVRAEHVLASAALPPAFPAVTIDGERYWDGGVASNTPISALADELTSDGSVDAIVFLIDLWDRQGVLPRSIDDVVWREKSIRYGSRKDAAAAVVRTHQLEVEARRIPPTRLEVCQVMRETPPGDAEPQFAFADADFTLQTYTRNKQLGYDDMAAALARPYRVPGVGGDYGILYRHGTYGKHRSTDEKFLALTGRKGRAMRAYRRAIESVRGDTGGQPVKPAIER